jgi:hypothetical protein
MAVCDFELEPGSSNLRPRGDTSSSLQYSRWAFLYWFQQHHVLKNVFTEPLTCGVDMQWGHGEESVHHPERRTCHSEFLSCFSTARPDCVLFLGILIRLSRSSIVIAEVAEHHGFKCRLFCTLGTNTTRTASSG